MDSDRRSRSIRGRSFVATGRFWGILLVIVAITGTLLGVVGPSGSMGAPKIVLTHGPVVGAVTPASAQVFVRTSGQTAGVVRVTGTGIDRSVRDVSFSTSSSTDFTAQVPLTNLVPTSTYTVGVLISGVLQPQQAAFKAFPPSGDSSPFSFVVVTDFAGPGESPSQGSTFVHADQEAPDFVYIGGDFDHSNPTTLDEKRQMFRKLYDPNLMPNLVNHILLKYAVAHNWDDHDYGQNNSNKQYPNKLLSLQVLSEYFPVYPLSSHGDWQSFTYGNADFFLLDSRSQRDPNSTPDGPSKSMLDGDNLGADGQLTWLKNGLLSSHATWKFIMTQVVFNPTMNKTDSWYGFQFERSSLVNFIKQNNIRGVILISGDLHAGGIDNGLNSDFPEMLVPTANLSSSSPVHCLSNPTTGTWSEGTYVSRGRKPCNGYGVVRVSSQGVRLQVKDEAGGLRIEYTVPLP